MKQSRKAKEIEARRTADPISQLVGREDIDYTDPDALPTAPRSVGQVTEIATFPKLTVSPERIIDDLLVLMRESPGWDFFCVDDAFLFLSQAKQADPALALTVRIADELRKRRML